MLRTERTRKESTILPPGGCVSFVEIGSILSLFAIPWNSTSWRLLVDNFLQFPPHSHHAFPNPSTYMYNLIESLVRIFQSQIIASWNLGVTKRIFLLLALSSWLKSKKKLRSPTSSHCAHPFPHATTSPVTCTRSAVATNALSPPLVIWFAYWIEHTGSQVPVALPGALITPVPSLNLPLRLRSRVFSSWTCETLILCKH